MVAVARSAPDKEKVMSHDETVQSQRKGPVEQQISGESRDQQPYGPGMGWQPSATAGPWEIRSPQLVLSLDLMNVIWRRAEQYDVHVGGRFEAMGHSIFIWSGPHTCRQTSRRCRARLLGWVTVVWEAPRAGTALLASLAWRPGVGGSEEEVWQALATLAGHPVHGRAVPAHPDSADCPS
jgi:hypothetical protein